MSKYFLAIDIGASSGRHIVGHREGEQIVCDEVYRFKNGVVPNGSHLIWDVDSLYENVLEGTRQAFLKYGNIESMAIDTWGVDYVLMRGDEAVMPVYAYRDARTENVIPKVHEIVSFEELYSKTGIQFQSFNTIYQLYADKLCGRLEGVTDFLMIPEYLSYKLTGVKMHEYTESSTTGLVNVDTLDYDTEIIEKLGLPQEIFKTPKAPGTLLGKLTDEVSKIVGGQTEVCLCASHDTASAVEGIPMECNAPFISSGTWSLLGAKIPHAITNKESHAANYSNEGGIGYIRYLKNIMGMWVINNLKAELAPEISFDDVMEMAMQSRFEGTVDLTDFKFLAPESMSEAITSCFDVENAPKTAGDLFKCAHLSLAQSYKRSLAELSRLTGESYDRLYIVGGGAKNRYINKLTEDFCGIKVVALPIEATAIGNLKVQMERER